MTESAPNPTADERLLAALAHLSIIACFFGPVLPLALWLSQQGRSAYVRRQSLHAMGYQVIAYWIYLFVVLLIPFGLILFGALWVIASGATLNDLSAMPGLIGIFNLVLYASIFGLLGLMGLVALIVGIRTWTGGNGRYPWLSNWLDRYLEGGEDRADRWLAGMAHGSAAWMLFGAVVPLVVWAFEKERSPLLRFHGLQALIFQLGYSLVFLGSLLLLLPLVIGLPFLLSALDSSATWVLILILVGMLLVLLVQLLFPLYQTFAIWAGVRVIRGHEPRYPLLGRLLDRRMKS